MVRRRWVPVGHAGRECSDDLRGDAASESDRRCVNKGFYGADRLSGKKGSWRHAELAPGRSNGQFGSVARLAKSALTISAQLRMEIGHPPKSIRGKRTAPAFSCLYRGRVRANDDVRRAAKPVSRNPDSARVETAAAPGDTSALRCGPAVKAAARRPAAARCQAAQGWAPGSARHRRLRKAIHQAERGACPIVLSRAIGQPGRASTFDKSPR
jgi:hypothetical protein